MTAKVFRKGIVLLAAVLMVTSPCWAKKVITDGKSKKSPIKVEETNFQDSGYGMPGPNAEIRISTKIKNTSKEDDVKNVVLKLQLKMGGGSVVQEWKKNIPVMKKGAVVEFDPGAVYYNYSFNNLQPGVEIEHDEIEKKDEKKEDK